MEALDGLAIAGLLGTDGQGKLGHQRTRVTAISGLGE
jgi:hypothetical protein